MRTASGIITLAAAANAAYSGFNYGATFSDGTIKTQADFEAEFSAAANLDGTDGAFTSARLYTMIQGPTPNDPISAIPAAIKTGTSLLLGMWASAGPDNFANEIAALKNAMTQYGEDLASIVAGISVGSEDLYRITETAAQNGEVNPGTQPDELANYISLVREAISGTVLANAKIGHVDTWTVWANASNQAVTNAVDWVGMDAYPYFEKEHANGVENAMQLFADAIASTNAGSGNKELWITETGWPVSGDTIGEAVPSLENAKIFWDLVGCPMFGNTNVWWYTFQDSNPVTPNPSFAVIGSEVGTTPLYDLSCKNITTIPTSSASDPTTTGGPSSESGTNSENPTSTTAGGNDDEQNDNAEDDSEGDGDNNSNDSIITATVPTGNDSPTASNSPADGETGGSNSNPDSESDSSGSGLGSDSSSNRGDGDDNEATTPSPDSTNNNESETDTSIAAALGHSLGAGVLAFAAAAVVFAM